ncbi:putative endonuclease/reverse transcriptase [Ceratocystis lukuohia]|uniref:Endonuclease/reverse transcriptase n=1 Tax=Ceratocystis lukuohia TaxID=2019550 RepID=A0ABR4MQY5_9PEZI
MFGTPNVPTRKRSLACVYRHTRFKIYPTAVIEAHPDISTIAAEIEGSTLQVISVYNARVNSVRTNEAVNLLKYLPRRLKNTVILGDFNLRHPGWDPRAVTARPEAEDFLDWMETNRFMLRNDRQQPTHDRGNVLDLTLVSADCWGKVTKYQCGGDIEAGSDHRPQMIDIQSRVMARPKTEARNMADTDHKKLQELSREAAETIRGNLEARGPDLTPKDLDETAEEITKAIHAAFEAATLTRKVSHSGYKWWNQECSDGKIAVCRTRANLESLWFLERQGLTDLGPEIASAAQAYDHARKQLKTAIQTAGRNFYRDLIGKLDTPQKIYQAAKWVANPQKTTSPALRDSGGQMRTSPAEKIEVLRHRYLLGNRLQDIQRPRIEARPTRWSEITQEEAKEAIFKPRNTAPGKDGIQNKILTWCWTEMGALITDLFNLCLTLGHHPTCFKEAKMVAIPKGGKRDRTDPSSYRLISLLPTMAKALERIIARRLSTEALGKGIFSANYACALSRRAASDLTLLVTTQTRSNMAKGRFTSILTFDIKGAFDGILPNSMVTRLMEQRWPNNLCKWVQSFLDARTAQISLDGDTEPPGPTLGSLPQGSPVSPILYMLFMAPLYKPWQQNLRGYMDDGLWIVDGQTLNQNLRGLRTVMERTTQWCGDNGLTLDHNKTGLLHLTTKQTKENPDLEVPGIPKIKATPNKGALKWLGVHFNRELNFYVQAKHVANKVERLTHNLRILKGCKHGAPTNEMVLVVKTCLIPSMTYAAATWWTPEKHGNIGKAERMEKPLRRALLAALPVKTTPSSLLHMEAGVPPPEQILHTAVARELIRWHTLESTHPLFGLKEHKSFSKLLRLLPKPPPIYGKIGDSFHPTDPPPSAAMVTRGDKDKAAQEHIAFKETRPPQDVWLYTDGSRLSSGWTGAGWALESGRQFVGSGLYSCGRWAEVADAEIKAIGKGLYSIPNRVLRSTNTVWICSDNQAAVRRMNKKAKSIKTSQHMIDEAKWLIQDWKATFPRLRFHCIWVPGHSDIHGNELADRKAKEAATRTTDYHMSLARTKRWLRETGEENLRKWFYSRAGIEDHPFRKHLEFPRKDRFRTPKESRKILGTILAAISGHGDFKEYHQRFKHHSAPLQCSACGMDKKETHKWTCKKTKKPWSENFVTKLLRTTKGRTTLGKVLMANAGQ